MIENLYRYQRFLTNQKRQCLIKLRNIKWLSTNLNQITKKDNRSRMTSLRMAGRSRYKIRILWIWIPKLSNKKTLARFSWIKFYRIYYWWVYNDSVRKKNQGFSWKFYFQLLFEKKGISFWKSSYEYVLWYLENCWKPALVSNKNSEDTYCTSQVRWLNPNNYSTFVLVIINGLGLFCLYWKWISYNV